MFLPAHQLREGVACVTVSGAGWAASTVCVEGYPLGDGAWHTVGAERHGHSLVVTVDDGDGWRRNESLVSLEALEGVAGPPPALEVDAGQGAAVGVWQEAAAETTQADLQDDLNKRESCQALCANVFMSFGLSFSTVLFNLSPAPYNETESVFLVRL